MKTVEAGDRLGIRRQNVLRAIKRGTLKAKWVEGAQGPYRGRWDVTEKDLDAYAAWLHDYRMAGLKRAMKLKRWRSHTGG